MSPKASIMFLAGNKCDMTENRQVSTLEAEEFAKNNDLIFLETSAKTGYNIDEVFFSAAKTVLEKIESGIFEFNGEVTFKF